MRAMLLPHPILALVVLALAAEWMLTLPAARREGGFFDSVSNFFKDTAGKAKTAVQGGVEAVKSSDDPHAKDPAGFGAPSRCQPRGPGYAPDLIADCDHTTRVQVGSEWCCHEGTADTGRDWGDGSGAEAKQCVVLPCGSVTVAPLPASTPYAPAAPAPPAPPAAPAAPARSKPPPYCQAAGPKKPLSGSCRYTTRMQVGSEWCCPAGTADTGYDWSDGTAKGGKQCAVLPCAGLKPAPPRRPGAARSPPPRRDSPPPFVAKTPPFCQPPGPKKALPDSCRYATRVQVGANWCCPAGTADTGYGWSDGPAKGAKQCAVLPCAGYASVAGPHRLTGPGNKKGAVTMTHRATTATAAPKGSTKSSTWTPTPAAADPHVRLHCTERTRRKCKKPWYRMEDNPDGTAVCRKCKVCRYAEPAKLEGRKRRKCPPGYTPNESAKLDFQCHSCRTVKREWVPA